MIGVRPPIRQRGIEGQGVRRTAIGIRQSGSATVEFALVLPLVLILGLATLEVALLVKDRLIIQGSARAGAREAAVTTDGDSVRAAAIEAAPGLDGSRITIRIEREEQGDGSVTVLVIYHDAIAVPGVSWLFPDAVDVTATAVMREETGG